GYWSDVSHRPRRWRGRGGCAPWSPTQNPNGSLSLPLSLPRYGRTLLLREMAPDADLPNPPPEGPSQEGEECARAQALQYGGGARTGDVGGAFNGGRAGAGFGAGGDRIGHSGGRDSWSGGSSNWMSYTPGLESNGCPSPGRKRAGLIAASPRPSSFESEATGLP